MKVWRQLGRGIDALAEIMGVIGWVLILYCMILGVTDVFLRYVLNSASLWISTTIQAAMVLLACVGGIYALKQDSFVRLDVFYAALSRRGRAICDLITSVFTFLFLWALIWKGWDAAMLSVMLDQHTPTAIPIPIYPIKIFIPITGVVVLLVVLKQLIVDIGVIAGRVTDEDDPQRA
ncbi:TRAP transporter small permease subunit [Spiribacter halobius]|uniref:TRAP transporter small permease protein n=1 Tax=Sediminicurvatus halobius TaxID=2182432 RepID=A0A2U2N5V7_9GAMM|nr:TRAP transporter small permease subunit [Spiribacter halobius]PWG64546.1 hypothetical protein DEM34_04255 [Spiribacter halobius]UEX79133.1 TRAP transporter small permease subunit [Spiribacter halobius]